MLGNQRIANLQVATILATDVTGLSSKIEMAQSTTLVIFMPAAWTAADLTFQASPDGGTTWYDVYDDDGQEVVVTAPAAGVCITPMWNLSQLEGLGVIRFRSGTAALAVQQGDDRVFKVIVKS